MSTANVGGSLDTRAARAAALATSTRGNYEEWVLKVLDGMVPYLDAKDKVLIRFLSEIPAINADILERVKKLARDPERVGLAVNAIQSVLLCSLV